ncbi:MAG: alginate lyase family protein [Lewinella sp.]
MQRTIPAKPVITNTNYPPLLVKRDRRGTELSNNWESHNAGLYAKANDPGSPWLFISSSKAKGGDVYRVAVRETPMNVYQKWGGIASILVSEGIITNTNSFGNNLNKVASTGPRQQVAVYEAASTKIMYQLAKGIILPEQINAEGGFIDELKRTKPYIYELFHLEGYSILAELASTESDNLWTFTENGRSLQKGWAFMLPYIKDKASWPYPPDVQNFDEVPLQTVGLLLAAKAYNDDQMMKIWKALKPNQNSPGIERNFPVRRPGLWVE